MDIFEYNDIFYTIEKQKYETKEAHIQRVWYIFNKLNSLENNNDIDVKFNEFKHISLLWSNNKRFKCGYNKEIMKKI